MTTGSEGGRPPVGPAEAQRIEDERQDALEAKEAAREALAGRQKDKFAAIRTDPEQAKIHAEALASHRAALTRREAEREAERLQDLPRSTRDLLVEELRERALDGAACPVCGTAPNGPTIRTKAGAAGLWQALAAARADFQPIKRDRTARIEGKEGKQGFEYQYATLDGVLSSIVPALSKHGIALTQPIWQSSSGQTIVSTILVHGESGQHVRADFPIPEPAQGEREPLKRMGSSITYARRYTLTSLVAIASEEDDDGHRGDREGGRGKAAEGAETTDAEREGKRIRGKLAGRLKAAFGEGEPWKDAQKIEVVKRITGKAWAQLQTMGSVELSRLLAERLELTIQDVKEGTAPRAWPTAPPPAATTPTPAPATERQPGDEEDAT